MTEPHATASPRFSSTVPAGIEATLEGSSERAQSLLEEVVSNKLPVTLTGQTREGLCSPAMIWAEYP